MEKVLICENVCKSFDSKEILKSINFSVYSGERIAICGKSGAGKTTLLGIIGALERADLGKVIFSGIEINKRNARAYRRTKAGFLFQDSCLVDEYTALENIRSAIHISRSGERAEEYLAMVGLGGKEKLYPAQMSGGESRRVALARALSKRPEILLLDEPTEGLDSETAHDIISLLLKLCAERGITVVAVTHDMNLARRMDRVLYLVQGSLNEGNDTL